MANLLQASEVYSHRPIALKEAPDVWETVAGIADTLFDPEQARADRELEYTKEMADKNYQLAQESLALDKRESEAQISASKDSSALAEKAFEANLFFETTKDMPLEYSSQLAREQGMTEVADMQESLKDSVMLAKSSINAAKASGNSSKIRDAISQNSSILDTAYGSSIKLDAEAEIEGIYAKRTLGRIASQPGVSELGIDASRWTNLTPQESLKVLEGLPMRVQLASGAQATKISILKTAADSLEGFYTQAADIGTATQTSKILEAYGRVLSPMLKDAGVDPEGLGLTTTAQQQQKQQQQQKPKPEPEPVVRISADAEKVSKSPLWKDENFMWISKDKKRKIFNARKAKQTLSKILNRNVTEKEARKIYEQLETVYGRTMVKAKDVIGEGLSAVGKGALGMTAVGRGVPPSIAFGDVDIPMSEAYASPQDAAEAQLQNQQDIEDILSGGIE